MTEQHNPDDDINGTPPVVDQGFALVDVPPPATAAPVRELCEWPDEVVAEIRAAEAGAQRSLCEIPDGDLPQELAEALERRIEVNLAQHDGGAVRRVGSTDTTVRELEAPWSRKARRAAGSAE